MSERLDGLTVENFTHDDFAGPWITLRWQVAFFLAKRGPRRLRHRAERELCELHVRMRLRARQVPFHMKLQEIATARQLGVFTSAEALSRIMIEFGRIVAVAREYPHIPEIDVAVASMRSAVKRCCRAPEGLDRPRGTGTTRAFDAGEYVPPDANPEWVKDKAP